jgi:hypothetical protein
VVLLADQVDDIRAEPMGNQAQGGHSYCPCFVLVKVVS